MIGYVNMGNIEEQVDADFARARRRAFLRRAKARLRSDPSSASMPSFEGVRKSLGALGGALPGVRVVRVEQIVGSVGRSSQFDGGFMPAKGDVEGRWKRIDRAFHRGTELPPVVLYEIGGSYFVLDGNHRVSVARYHDVEMIDAEITVFRTNSAKNSAPYGCSEDRQKP